MSQGTYISMEIKGGIGMSKIITKAVCIFIIGMVIPTAVIAKSKVTIALWPLNGKPAISDDLIQEFQQANPDVVVEQLTLPSGYVYDQWIKVLIASGVSPDIYAVGDWNIREYIDLGLIAPLDITAAGYSSIQMVLSEYLPGSLNAFIVDGKMYGLPQEWNTVLLYFNKDMLEESGVKEPVFDFFNADAFMSTALKLIRMDANGVVTRAAVTSEGWSNALLSTFEFNAHVRSFGGSFFDVDNKTIIDNVASRTAFRYLNDLVHGKRLAANQLSFISRNTAMAFSGPWRIPAFMQNGIDFDVVPWTIGEKTIVPEYAWIWVLNKSSNEIAAASRFMRYSLIDNGDYWAYNLSFIHPRSDFARYQIYRERPALLKFVKAVEMAQYAESAPRYGEFSSAVQKLVYSAVSTNPKPIDQAFGNAVQEIKNIIGK